MKFAVAALLLGAIWPARAQITVVAPLSTRQKVDLAVKSSIDPMNLAGVAISATISQAADWNPRYGQGAGAFAERLGATTADMAAGNFLSKAVLAPLLHEDPRYFPKGRSAGVRMRMLYALSRAFVCRSDEGHLTVNGAGLLGTVTGAAVSSAYYPPISNGGSAYAWRVLWGVVGSAANNLAPEFWPEIRRRLFHRPKRNPDGSQTSGRTSQP